MTAILTSDLHLTNKAPDEYRWDFINQWLPKLIDHKKASELYILGDLTDSKDGHNSKLVNRIVEAITMLAAKVKQVYILKGNHDFTDPDYPYFKFLSNLNSVRYVSGSEPIRTGLGNCLFIANTRRPRRDFNKYQFNKYDYVFIHQAVVGAKISEGFRLKEDQGLRSIQFKKNSRIIAGDIHMPQTVNNVTYCGAPYPIDFSDTYSPRVLIADGRKVTSMPVTTIRKADLAITKIKELDECGLNIGDQLQLTLRLPKEELIDWSKRKREVELWCEQHQVRLHSVSLSSDEHSPSVKRTDVKLHTAAEALEHYCKIHKIKDRLLVRGNKLMLAYERNKSEFNKNKSI